MEFLQKKKILKFIWNQKRLIIPESGKVVTRGWGAERKRGDTDEKIQAFSYKVKKFGDLVYNMVTVITMYCVLEIC